MTYTEYKIDVNVLKDVINSWSFNIWAVFLPLLDTLNPKNNTANTCGKFRRNRLYQIHKTKVVVYVCQSQIQSKCQPNWHFSWQDKKVNKVVNTLRTKFLLGVSHIWYQTSILKTFEKFLSHGSKNYYCLA